MTDDAKSIVAGSAMVVCMALLIRHLVLRVWSHVIENRENEARALRLRREYPDAPENAPPEAKGKAPVIRARSAEGAYSQPA